MLKQVELLAVLVPLRSCSYAQWCYGTTLTCYFQYVMINILEAKDIVLKTGLLLAHSIMLGPSTCKWFETLLAHHRLD